MQLDPGAQIAKLGFHPPDQPHFSPMPASLRDGAEMEPRSVRPVTDEATGCVASKLLGIATLHPIRQAERRIAVKVLVMMYVIAGKLMLLETILMVSYFAVSIASVLSPLNAFQLGAGAESIFRSNSKKSLVELN
jgi:hypothetical protein